jgi:hypothetical protein
MQESKAPNILVVSTKGGTGKSMLSQQILATYNLSRFGKSKIVEVDDENLDSKWLASGESQIHAVQVSLGSDPDDFPMAIAEALPIDSEGLVLDVGGNRTASIVIKELSRMRARARVLDAICIPISDNRMGVTNAERTLKEIEASPDGKYLISRCFLAVNRVRARSARSIDDPKLIRRFRQAAMLARKWRMEVLIVHDMDGAENLAPLGKTIFEIADVAEDLNEQLCDQIVAAHKSGDLERTALLDDLQWGVSVAANDFLPLVKFSHEQLDGILLKLRNC